MRWLPLVALVVAMPASELPGGGQPPLPAALVGDAAGLWWFGYSNDNLGAPRYDRGDDFRTNQLWAGWQPTAWLRLAAEHSVLTDENPSGARPDWSAADPYAAYEEGAIRCDELTLTAVAVLPTEFGGRRWGEVWAGPGVRFAGNAGGAAMQEQAHGLFGLTPLAVPYEEPEESWTPLLTAGGGWVVGTQAWPRLWLSLNGLATASGQVQADGAMRLLVAGPRASWWIGPEWRIRDGGGLSDTAASVAANEARAWLQTGFDAGPFTAAIGRSLESDAVGGRLGLVLGRKPGPAGPDLPAFGELGAVFPGEPTSGKGIAASLRFGLPGGDGWWRDRLSAGAAWRRQEYRVPYHFDNHATGQELLAVVDLALHPPRESGLTLDPYVQAAAGWYHGQVELLGGVPVTDPAELSTVRVHGVIGLRLWLATEAPGQGGWCLALGGDLDWAWSPEEHQAEYDLAGRGITVPVGGASSSGNEVVLGGSSLSANLRATVALAW